MVETRRFAEFNEKGRRQSVDEIAAWCGGTVVISLKTLRPAIDVQTRLGLERVEYGDYILKDPRGDFSVMSEKAFLGSYERLDGTSER